MSISNRLKTIAEAVTPGFRAADIGTDHGYVPICLLRNGISPYVIAADLSPGSLEKARVNLARAGYLSDPEVSDGGAVEAPAGRVFGGAAVEKPEFPGSETSETPIDGAPEAPIAETCIASTAGTTENADTETAAPQFSKTAALAECRLSDGLKEIRPGEVDAIIISGMGGILMGRILREGIDVVLQAKELILSPHRDTQLLRDFAAEFGFSILRDEQFSDKNKTYPLLKIQIEKKP